MEEKLQNTRVLPFVATSMHGYLIVHLIIADKYGIKVLEQSYSKQHEMNVRVRKHHKMAKLHDFFYGRQ